MKTNDIKKGMRFKLRNGWWATMADNKKGNIRTATVEGYVTEWGSVYAHDIVLVVLDEPVDGNNLVRVEHTPAQEKLRKQVEGLFDA